MFRCWNRLKKAKCYLKIEYRVYCRYEDSRCADHCRKFALSDPVDEDFKHQYLHDHYQSVAVARN